MARPRAQPLGLQASFGFGDRLGLATPGHLQALQEAGGPIAGVFAQQSVREMQRTGRSPRQVMVDAVEALAEAGYDRPWGADADHLKTEQDALAAVEAGYTFYTLDPSDAVDSRADFDDHEALRQKYVQVRDQVPWVERYRDRTIRVNDGPIIVFDEMTLMRAAVKYGRAVNRAVALAEVIDRAAKGRDLDYEIELSVDETDQPTSPAEHYLIAEQCLQAGIKLVSLAPRWIGAFEKGIDYIGDRQALARSITEHAAIARELGPYKLSLHSGSDKLSVYPILAEAAGGRFHVKTAGTSYLEALRVVLRREPALFRQIVDFARRHYDQDRTTYHVHAEPAALPRPDRLDDKTLERVYLDDWSEVPNGRGMTQPGRQVLHCTFGSVLSDDRLGPAVRQVVDDHREDYRQVLAEHFGRHLAALNAGLRRRGIA